MNTTKDTFGNTIQAGDMIMRVLQSTFAFHRVIHVTKTGNLKVQRIRWRYKTTHNTRIYYNNPTSLQEAENIPIHQTEGALYLNQWTQYVKIKSEEQWTIQK